MNGYRIRRDTFEWRGNEVNGWIILDTVGGETVVATILGGDSGQVFKAKLIEAGAVEER